MSSTIIVPTLAQLANYPPQIAQKLIDVATQAQADVNLLQGGGVAGAAPIHFARVATTAALATNTYSSTAQTLTKSSAGALGTIDGVTMAVGDRVLVTAESTASNNGLYVVTSLGGATAWVLTRASDASASADFQSGMIVSVSEGTAGLDSFWTLTTNTSTGIVLDTTSLTFAKFASALTPKVEARMQQATSAASVTEVAFYEVIAAGTVTAVHYVPSANSTPASGSNNQVITVSVRDGAGGAAAQIAQATLANATPFTAFVPFDLGAITNGTLTAGQILTFNTVLTGTASLSGGVVVVQIKRN